MSECIFLDSVMRPTNRTIFFPSSFGCRIEERPLTNFMTIEVLKVYAVQKNGDWVDRIMGLDPFSNEFAGSDYPICIFCGFSVCPCNPSYVNFLSD